MSSRRVVASLIVLTAMTAALSSARADGVSFTFRPRGESAEAIREGLGVYNLFRSFGNRAKTNQRGSSNGAAIAQHGRSNNAYVFQRGRDNSGSITQNGSYNAFGLFQFGRRNSTTVVQNGNGEVGFTLQGNW